MTKARISFLSYDGRWIEGTGAMSLVQRCLQSFSFLTSPDCSLLAGLVDVGNAGAVQYIHIDFGGKRADGPMSLPNWAVIE
jgi:hypothetical protein